MSLSRIIPFTTVHRYNDLLGICVNVTTAPTDPRPFHIAFLIDVSGSMEGERIETVQRTLRLFTEQMTEGNDHVTMISYSSSAKCLCLAETKKAPLLAIIDDLHAQGGTNMESAFYTLLEADMSTVDAVFLLTDGEVNQGIRTVTGLETLLRSVVKGIPVYTLGYGDSHNAKLLQAIALSTGSSYTYAETNEMIPAVAGSILVAMREEIAKGVTLEWDEIPESHAVSCWEYGTDPDARSVRIGSIIANKPQWVVLQGPVTGLRLRVSGVAAAEEVVTLPVPLADEPDSAVEVLEQWYRVRAATAFLDLPFTLGKLASLEAEIAGHGKTLATRPLILRLLAEIAEQRKFFTGPKAQRNRHYATRMSSNATAFATQRGGFIPEFNSPSQRLVSDTMVTGFKTQDPC